MDLYKQMKLIAQEAAKAYEKKLYYGTVTAVSPLTVKVDQRFTLTAEFLTMSEGLTELSYNKAVSVSSDLTINYEKIVIRPGLAAGDRVLLIEMENSDYFIMDRVV